jgi:hypothetical protein
MVLSPSMYQPLVDPNMFGSLLPQFDGGFDIDRMP